MGRALHAWVVPRQAGVAHAWEHFDEQGALNDDKLAARLRAVGEQVARFCALHTSETAQEFMRVWEGAPDNPGGA